MATDVQDVSEAEVEAFRKEVSEWLDQNLDGVGAPPDGGDTTQEQFDANQAFFRKLGEKGWYAPGWPKEYGGGGLPPAKVEVIQQLLNDRVTRHNNVRKPGDISSAVASSVWIHGTDEQKQKFLPPILKGEVTNWELFTEPNSGSDLPSLQTRAVREGDHYVLNGSKIWVGGNFYGDQYFVMAVTDPAAARHRNLSTFIVPADLPGMTVIPITMIGGHKKNQIMMDDVVVPVGNRIGEEGSGWSQFMLHIGEFGHLGLPGGLGVNEVAVRDLFDYARTTKKGGKRIIDRPRERAALATLWMQSQVGELMDKRNQRNAAEAHEEVSKDAAPRGTYNERSYQGAQASLRRKLFGLEVSEAIMKVMGPLATISDTGWAPYDGGLEYIQRQAIVNTHPGGTRETQKTLMFRGMAAARNLKEVKPSR